MTKKNRRKRLNDIRRLRKWRDRCIECYDSYHRFRHQVGRCPWVCKVRLTEEQCQDIWELQFYDGHQTKLHSRFNGGEDETWLMKEVMRRVYRTCIRDYIHGQKHCKEKVYGAQH